MFEIRPVITETSMNLAKKGWYTFAVPVELNKNVLRKQIEQAFKVNVVDIKTAVVKGKRRRSLKTRQSRTLPDWKKTIVKVRADQKIDIFETGV